MTGPSSDTTGVPIRRDIRDVHEERKGQVETQQESGQLQAKERASEPNLLKP